MRLSQKDADTATYELLEILTNSEDGKLTSELVGTKKFHGTRTLTPKQIVKLLRGYPTFAFVSEEFEGSGYKAPIRWRMKKQPLTPEQRRKLNELPGWAEFTV